MQPQRLARDVGGVELSPTFTLGTALAWLGHDCPGGCPEAVAEDRSTVWFSRLARTSLRTWTRTLVEVEFADPAVSGRCAGVLVSEVNRCVHRDRIRVRVRSAVEREVFFAALAVRWS